MGVVVRMALQLEHHQVGHQVVAVPGVVRLATLISSTGQPTALQAVVFDVVGRGQLERTPERHQRQHRHHGPAVQCDQAAVQRCGQRTGLQDLVVPMPAGHATVFQPLRFQAPGAYKRSWHFAQNEAVDALSQARRGRVFGRGHMPVVPSVVFDGEMPVPAQRAVEQGQLAAEPVALVAELMAQVQAKAQHRPGHQHGGDPAAPGQSVGGQKDAVEQGGEPQHRQNRIVDGAVVRFRFQPRHLGFGRVAEVLTQQPVQQGHQSVKTQQRQKEPDRAAGAQAVGDRPRQRQRRAEHGEQPAMAFAVTVGRGVVFGLLKEGFHQHIVVAGWPIDQRGHRSPRRPPTPQGVPASAAS